MNILQIISDAFDQIQRHTKILVNSLLIPFSILIIIDMPDKSSSFSFFSIITFIISFFAYTIVAITTHRVILLGADAVPKWGVYKPTMREINFILYTIGLMFIMVPIFFLFTIPVIGIITGAILMLYFLGRLSLVFPALATDRSWSFSDSWHATQNYQLAMFFVVGLFPIIAGIPAYLISYFPLVSWLSGIINLLATVMVIAVLSTSFKAITEEAYES